MVTYVCALCTAMFYFYIADRQNIASMSVVVIIGQKLRWLPPGGES